MVLRRNLLNFLHIADISIYMYRNDGDGTIRNKTFNLRFIHRSVFRLNIAENRLQTISHNGMGGGNKRKGSGDNLSPRRKIKRLNRQFQRHMPVYHQRYFRYSKIFL